MEVIKKETDWTVLTGIHLDFRLCEILQIDKLGQNMDIMWIEFYQKKNLTNKILLSSSIFH